MAVIEATPAKTYATYRVSVDEYVRFREKGYLVVKGLVPPDDVAEMNAFMDDMLAGRRAISGALIMKDLGQKPGSPGEWLRAHMLHRRSPIHERFLLHPRTLDVLQALIGPDLLALQSMLFFKQPGQPGQGYHQDAYYLPTFPDTLCGAWLALTPATRQNGCLYFAVGSQNEPVYPDPRGTGQALSQNFSDLGTIEHPSATDESLNGLSRVVKKYAGRADAVEAEPGDVVFFGGHVVHWSYTNQADFPRRSYVGHYCNARSLVLWNHGEPWDGDSANYLHILARGRTHLPYAQPLFGTPCAANAPQAALDVGPLQPMSMMGLDDGLMGASEHPAQEPEDR
ncbi:MAG: phytanoyl-CoA dioxygenase family protein [Anaerolineales bacterium]|nr:phytanoyl-CoA dioxygenase family protein [Anaerolineales bacterium]